MGGLGYVRMEEVPGIPVLARTPGAVVYAPLGDTPVDPDVVLVAGRPGRLMLLLEAAGRDLARVAAELATILSANDTLADYHRGRRRTLATE